MTAPVSRYHIFIAGERMGGAYGTSPENAVRVWIAHTDDRPMADIADSHHCRVTDIWAEPIGEKVYS